MSNFMHLHLNRIGNIFVDTVTGLTTILFIGLMIYYFTPVPWDQGWAAVSDGFGYGINFVLSYMGGEETLLAAGDAQPWNRFCFIVGVVAFVSVLLGILIILMQFFVELARNILVMVQSAFLVVASILDQILRAVRSSHNK